MVDEQVDEQNDRDRDAVDALLDGLHAPVTPQPKPQPTPEPTPEHDYYFCRLSDCQRCADYADGYTDSALDAREWELGEHEPDCDCTPCETVREVIRSFVGMLRSEHGPQDTGRRHRR